MKENTTLIKNKKNVIKNYFFVIFIVNFLLVSSACSNLKSNNNTESKNIFTFVMKYNNNKNIYISNDNIIYKDDNLKNNLINKKTSIDKLIENNDAKNMNDGGSQLYTIQENLFVILCHTTQDVNDIYISDDYNLLINYACKK